MEAELQKKIDRAIKLIRLSAPEDGSPIEVAYSGGKDSDVILQLTKESGVNYRAIYKNTTIDPPGTIAHAREMGAEIHQPRSGKGFFWYVEQWGYPNQFASFCCRYLKEYAVLDKAIVGVRKAESVKRAQRYKEPTACRAYKDGSRAEHIYPILDWTNEDVVEYIADRNIKCHPLYYTNGKFNAEKRLGCMCCPLASKAKRLEQFKEHPRMVKAYLLAGRRFMKLHPERSMQYANEYEYFVRELFYEKQSDWEQSKQGMFERMDCKEFIEQYFNINL